MYIVGSKIGQGTFATVFKCTRSKDKAEFALKRPRPYGYGCSWYSYREIKILLELKHPNVIEVEEAYIDKEDMSIVMPLCLWNLDDVICSGDTPLFLADIKSYSRMMLEALAYCHGKHVVHRDIKANNFLMGPDKQLKLGDFGSARVFEMLPDEYEAPVSPQAVTLWYRAPELLYGSKDHHPSIDMWSIGCVVGEMVKRDILFKGSGEIQQLSAIFAVIGVPTSCSWPGVEDLPYYMPFKPNTPVCLSKHIEREGMLVTESLADLVTKLLNPDPKSRLCASSALCHPFFIELPTETKPSLLSPPIGQRNQLQEEEEMDSWF